MSHLTPAIILTVAALSIRWPLPVGMTNLSLSIPSKNFELPFTYASLACLSKAINASAVGAAATGLVVFVFALFAPVLAAGAPHAAKNFDAAANKINRSVFFITILLRYDFDDEVSTGSGSDRVS